jgi:hypothetical protein
MSATRAITIDAPASTIWPWLVQMGSARGGAWIKNIFGLDVHSAEEILPEFQHLEVGDVLPMGGAGAFSSLSNRSPLQQEASPRRGSSRLDSTSRAPRGACAPACRLRPRTP